MSMQLIGGRCWRQSGQALVEALVVLTALLMFWVAVAWLGRFQDIALQASHASRYAAFAEARGETVHSDAVRHGFFTGVSHRWSDRKGKRLFSEDGRETGLRVVRGSPLSAMAQAGRDAPAANALREAWKLADTGVVDARVEVQLVGVVSQKNDRSSTFMSGLRDFDAPYPRLVRHTAILTNAGHATDDDAVQLRVADAGMPWSDAAGRSYGLSAQVSSPMRAVDAGWKRSPPATDWARAWAGAVPEHYLKTSGDQP